MGKGAIHYIAHGGGLLFTGVDRLDLGASCSCGQCFRWCPGSAGAWQGVVRGRLVTARREGDTLWIHPASVEDGPLWADYFDLERAYGAIEGKISGDARLRPALDAARGIRIFRQEPFETLISFIISANNNIPRIRGIIERLCALAGRPLLPGAYAFPTPAALARLSEADMRGIGAGYRAPFILGSARRVYEGFDLEALRNVPLKEARKALCTLPGVGPKVADCVALFSLGHTSAFPMDVWMKRAVKTMLFAGEDMSASQLESAIAELGSEAGILQQYIFHYARQNLGS
ncbi:MAG: DNA glycosylase [Candidatus Pelethousia sp.]|nr:DNA glycosylase [Candidatus Pelethousia sp.]